MATQTPEVMPLPNGVPNPIHVEYKKKRIDQDVPRAGIACPVFLWILYAIAGVIILFLIVNGLYHVNSPVIDYDGFCTWCALVGHTVSDYYAQTMVNLDACNVTTVNETKLVAILHDEWNWEFQQQQFFQNCTEGRGNNTDFSKIQYVHDWFNCRHAVGLTLWDRSLGPLAFACESKLSGANVTEIIAKAIRNSTSTTLEFYCTGKLLVWIIVIVVIVFVALVVVFKYITAQAKRCTLNWN